MYFVYVLVFIVFVGIFSRWNGFVELNWLIVVELMVLECMNMLNLLFLNVWFVVDYVSLIVL